MTKHRCGWCKGDDLYEAYHDLEWGVPVKDDNTLFEFLILETFQAGLSWITILRKRESLLQNEGIIRNKLKVRSTISNAEAFIKIQKEFGSFSTYIWGFIDGTPIKNTVENYKHAPPNTALSDTISKDLKKRGFKFVGSTVIYAHMQATGMVNDHELNCFRYNEV